MTAVFIILVSFLFFFFLLNRRNNRTPKEVEFPAFASEENLNEPIISYSIYTVDTILHHRYLNYTHVDFPNHVGILKGQYLEIDWNVINADLITISGVGLVKAVGRKAFYPTQNTSYTITAKNKEYELQQTIYVRVFPQNITDNLFSKNPEIKIQLQQKNNLPEVLKFPDISIKHPIVKIKAPTITPLHEVLQNKIVSKTISQKLKDYLQQTVKKNN
ncbi:MAG TPA: hypothetical protein PLL99_03800 [Chitinophagales bacterium]|nr:hypothetical protein [Chitinophagales bacterium]